MTIEMIILSCIIGVAMVLFALDLYPADKVSLLILGSLVATRLVTPEQAVAGFGNAATITVACMLALSLGVQRTGGLNFVANRIVDLAGSNERTVLLTIMLAVGVLSAFINNTAAVALFLPLTIAVSRQQGFEISKLLMPMSFAAIFAGTCTLIGTSTNLLVYAEVQRELGLEIGMFDFTPMGLVLFASGTIYMYFIGIKLIPLRRRSAKLSEDFHLRQYITDLEVLTTSPLVGGTVSEAKLGELYNMDVLEILRGKERMLANSPGTMIEAGDHLLVSGEPSRLLQVQREQGLRVKVLKLPQVDLEDENIVLVEAWISPSSRLIESTLKESGFRNRYKATALAIRSHRGTVREKIGNFKLEYGDSLLILTTRDRLDELSQSSDFLVFEEVRGRVVVRRKVYWALGIFVGLVVLASSGLLSILEAAVMGVAAMALTRVIRLHDVYASISWQTIVMLGCMIPLGSAMDGTGLAAYIAGHLVNLLKDMGPVAVLSGIYLLTTILTSIMSNNATAVLMVPVCVSAAGALSVSPLPFIFAVMFAASASFMTPVGYQTNLFIMGPGGYRFADFLRVGAPLNLLFWLLASFLIPVFWPF